MAIDFYTSFEGMQTADLTLGLFATAGNPTVGSTAGVARTGSRYMQVSADAVYKPNLANEASRVVGYSFRTNNIAGAGSVTNFTFSDGIPTVAGNVQVGFTIQTDGTIIAHRGRALNTSSGGTVLGTSSACILLSNTQYYIEFAATFHDTTGSVEIRVGGATVLTLTGIDTKSTANAYANCIGFNGFSTQNCQFDDIYSAHGSGGGVTTFLGPRVKIYGGVASSGDGSVAQFTPSTGTDNGAMVDETPHDGDTTYNSSTTPGNIDVYNFAAIGLTGTVKAVQVKNMARVDSGAAGIRNVSRIGGTNYFGAAKILAGTYAYGAIEPQELSPATAAAWTVAEIDGAEFGLEHNT